MVVLSFLENVKDKKAWILPSPYKETVEDATQPQLPLPAYNDVLFLCDSANANPDCISDIVRAIRRRIANDDPKVQYLVVLLLDAIIKACGLSLHAEVASQKGLLRDLQSIATRRHCITQKERQAREAALALILNLSIWFNGHPDGRVYILTTIADDVRHESGPNAFEGIHPDTNTQIAINNNNSQRSRPSSGARPNRTRTNEPRGPVVDAIGINFPKEEEVAAMLDACMTLAEYINNLKVNDDGSIPLDDVIRSFRAKIKDDHTRVTVLLSSDLKLDNRDVLRDILESQSALMRRLDSETRLISPPSHTDPTSHSFGVHSGVDNTNKHYPQGTTRIEDTPFQTSTALSGAIPPETFSEPTLPSPHYQQPPQQQQQSYVTDGSSREAGKAAEAAADAAVMDVMDVFQGLSAPVVVPSCEPGDKDCGVTPINIEEQQQREQEPIHREDAQFGQLMPREEGEGEEEEEEGDENVDGNVKAHEQGQQREEIENADEGGHPGTQSRDEEDDFDAFIEGRLTK